MSLPERLMSSSGSAGWMATCSVFPESSAVYHPCIILQVELGPTTCAHPAKLGDLTMSSGIAGGLGSNMRAVPGNAAPARRVPGAPEEPAEGTGEAEFPGRHVGGFPAPGPWGLLPHLCRHPNPEPHRCPGAEAAPRVHNADLLQLHRLSGTSSASAEES